MNTVNDYLKKGSTDIIPILSLVLERSVASIISSSDYRVSKKEAVKLNEMIAKRDKGVPFAYLSQQKGFYHLDFKVSEATLIPRPETELLVDIAIDLFDENDDRDILDLGTGSGAIAISIADKRANWKLTATDLSVEALNVAKQNTKSDIVFLHGSWFDTVENKKFDLVVCNPPYVADDDPHLKDLEFEPILALTSGRDGLDDIKSIIINSPNHIKEDGYLLLEHGYNQQEEITKLLSKDFHNITKFKDYNNLDRAILAQLKSEVGL